MINIDLDILKYLEDNCINKTQIVNKLLRDYIELKNKKDKTDVYKL